MHEASKFWGEGLLAVAFGVGRVVVDLDDEAVGASGYGGQGQGLHHPVHAGGVGGPRSRQVAHLLNGGDGGHIQSVAGVGLEGAHPRSQRITFSFPADMIYSADMIHSS